MRNGTVRVTDRDFLLGRASRRAATALLLCTGLFGFAAAESAQHAPGGVGTSVTPLTGPSLPGATRRVPGAADRLDHAREFVCSTATSAITPCTGTATNSTNRVLQKAVFTIQNKTIEPIAYPLSVVCTGQVNSCTTPASVTVQANSSKNDTVTYSTASTGGSGTISLTADDGFSPITGVITVTVSVPPPTTLYIAQVAPHYQLRELDSAKVDTASFVLSNPGQDNSSFGWTVTCSGAAIVGACSPTSGSVTLNAGTSTTVSTSYTIGAAAASTGTVRLTLTRTGDATVRDSGQVDVVTSRNASLVDVVNQNPGATEERDLCLTISMGPGAAYECADLRLVHALPGVRTMNRSRAPVLLYNSRHAHPRPLVQADVTLPDTRIPTTVAAQLLDSAGAAIAGASGSWAGSQWTAHSTRRIAVSFDGLAWPTGRHRYTLQITRTYGVTPEVSTAAGEFFVVNRSTSPYGAGWWVAGVEQLFLAGADLLWIGGDGSARRYLAAGANVWAATAVDRPDTIRKVGSVYERYLPHKLIVRFDGTTLLHTQTVNRLGQVTGFTYFTSPSRLNQITLPSGSLARSYTFGYNGTNKLLTVTAPPVGAAARTVGVVVDGSGRLTSITLNSSPAAVTFGYDPGETNRINTRTNENGFATTFAFGSAGVLNSVTVPRDVGVSDVSSFVPAETRGLAGTTAQPGQLAYTKFDGPRTDVGDTTLFWTDRFRGVRRTRNALGDETTLLRANAMYPALVTRARYPNARILGATYDTRGNIATLTDSSNQSPPGTYATTTYVWNIPCDFVNQITNPMGDLLAFAYDSTTTCNRKWQKDGRGDSTKVRFGYNANGLMQSDTSATGAVDNVTYDASLSNLQQVTSPLGRYVSYVADEIGRDTLVTTPTQGAVVLKERTLFDLRSRPKRKVSYAPTGGTTDSLITTMTYDSVGNLVTLTKQSIPDANASGVITHSFTYDRRNLATAELLVGYNTVNFGYDPAGNLVSGGRQPSTNVYDALNRVSTKVATYGSANDTSKFVYDEVGNLRAANDHEARIARTYNPNGTLKADTLRIVTRRWAERNFGSHIYGLTYAYDLNGRRTSMTHSGALSPSATPQTYTYNAGAGFLQSMSDVNSNAYQFRYDADTRLKRVTRRSQAADSVWETMTYDNLSQLVTHHQQALGITLHDDNLTYDLRGKVLSNTLTGESVGYSGLGYLTSTALSAGAETYTYDALGDRKTAQTFGSGHTQNNYTYWPNAGRMKQAAHPGTTPADTTYYTINTDGAVGQELRVHPPATGSGVPYVEKRSTLNTYSTDKRLTSSKFQLDTTPAPPGQYKSYSRNESYRYDALGRRVWQEMIRDTALNVCATHDATSGCRNEVMRTMWDGDQVLYEVRAPSDTVNEGSESDNAPGVFAGRVGYTNALGIDAPLSVFKGSSDIMFPVADWRGGYDKGWCQATAAVCSGATYYFPGAQANVYGDVPPPPLGPASWHGNVIGGQRDGNGYQYKRNRYYDPVSGRFTQEDPIGLAGGANLYGFADGDPANFSDPFGLCPPFQSCPVRPGMFMGALLNGVGQTYEKVKNDPRTEVALLIVGSFAPEATAAGGALRLYRAARGAETVARLARDAARAEAADLPHGISATSNPAGLRNPSDAGPGATIEEIEQHFTVHKTGADPAHYTVELPKPVTKQVADILNRLFRPQ